MTDARQPTERVRSAPKRPPWGEPLDEEERRRQLEEWSRNVAIRTGRVPAWAMEAQPASFAGKLARLIFDKASFIAFVASVIWVLVSWNWAASASAVAALVAWRVAVAMRWRDLREEAAAAAAAAGGGQVAPDAAQETAPAGYAHRGWSNTDDGDDDDDWREWEASDLHSDQADDWDGDEPDAGARNEYDED